jgi:hypothetical protein
MTRQPVAGFAWVVRVANMQNVTQCAKCDETPLPLPQNRPRHKQQE